MDFFEYQDRARRSTTLLVLAFFLAVMGMVGVTHSLVTALFGVPRPDEVLDSRLLWNPQLFGFVLTSTLLVVGSGTLYKMSQLNGGGGVVAENLGGRPLEGDSLDPLERKVLNVVEEMAIASGLPVPPVYFLDKEDGINAFAAGHSPEDAVIGITRGCAEHLTRDQLQGVVAHEFSHILNGDMRLNIRLIGVLHGILVLGIMGYYLMRFAAASSRGRRRDQGNPVAVIAFGFGLMAIGFIGTFFGNLIKAAVSRQREYLADASAVQFTRNPQGIAGALKAIGRLAQGSRLHTAGASEASHLFFGQGVGFWFSGLFATHPPLGKRILRLDPSWEGQYEEAAEQVKAPPKPLKRKPSQLPPRLGNLGLQQVRHSILLLAALEESLREASREPYGARALVYNLALSADEGVLQEQLECLEKEADPKVFEEVQRLRSQVQGLPRGSRLPLADLALPALKRLSPEQYQRFRRNLRHLMIQDEVMDLFEWCLGRSVLHTLDLTFGLRGRTKPKVFDLQRESAAVTRLLGVLAHVGHSESVLAQKAFDEGVEKAKLTPGALPPRSELGLSQLDEALEILDGLGPLPKRDLVLACQAVAFSDGQLQVQEYELIRAIADSLSVPLPPMVEESE